jgi:DNA-binding response OmpR family regulator
MLTAMGQRSDRLRAREVGADHFVTKPFDEEELVAILRSLTGAA